LFPGYAMPFDMLDPGPCNGNSPFSVRHLEKRSCKSWNY
jgi:hypothetical protein